MFKESAGDKSTEEKKGGKKKEVTRRMDVREQPGKKKGAHQELSQRGETRQEGAKERGAGRGEEEEGVAVSSAGVPEPAQLCSGGQLRQGSKNLVLPLQRSRCHVRSGSRTSSQ